MEALVFYLKKINYKINFERSVSFTNSPILSLIYLESTIIFSPDLSVAVKPWKGEAPSPHALNCHRGEALANILNCFGFWGEVANLSWGSQSHKKLSNFATSGKNSIVYEENRIAE